MDYANSILYTMYSYMLDTIEAKGLSFKGYDIKNREAIFKDIKDAGLEYGAYFLFKMHYDKDKRYAFERLEKYDDFSEFIPIAPY
jgi:hypothetical protein